MSSTLPSAPLAQPDLSVIRVLPNLMRELDGAPVVDGRYAPILVGRKELASEAAGRMCPRCCHWSLPLAPPYLGRDLPHGVAMMFHEWLVWHLHVVTHQMGVLVS